MVCKPGLLFKFMLLIQPSHGCFGFLTRRLLFGLRRRRGNVEPGVGKMVSYLNREKKLDSMVGCRPVAPAAPKGIYLYGNVGSGISSKHLTFLDMKQNF